MRRIKTLAVAFLLAASTSQAAVPPTKSKPTSVAKILAGEGVTFGGLAGSGFTMLDVRRTADLRKKVERIVIDVGDRNGGINRGLPGYYYAELKKNPSRLVIDFSQMPIAKIDAAGLASRMKNSLAIQGASMSIDPVDNSLNLTFDLKKNTKVRVYQVSGNKATSKVVIDMLAE